MRGGARGEFFVGAEVFLAFGAEIGDGVGAVGEVAGVEMFGEGVGEIDKGAAGLFEGVERFFGLGDIDVSGAGISAHLDRSDIDMFSAGLEFHF